MNRDRLCIPPWAILIIAIAISSLAGLAIYGLWLLLKDQSVEANFTESYTKNYDAVTMFTEKFVDEEFVFTGKETINRGDETLQGDVTWTRESHEHDLRTESKRVEEEHATKRVTIIASTVGSIFVLAAIAIIILTCIVCYFKTKGKNTNCPSSSTTRDIELQVMPTNRSQQSKSHNTVIKNNEPFHSSKKAPAKNLRKVTAQVIRSDDCVPSKTPVPPKNLAHPQTNLTTSNKTPATDRLTDLELLVSMGLDANDCMKALKYEQDIQKVADTMFQLKEKAPQIGEYSSVKTSGESMEEQGDESEIDDGPQEDEPETDSNPE